MIGPDTPTPPLSSERVEAIRERLAVATPGSWDSCGMDDADWIKPDQEYAVTVWKHDDKGLGRAVACDVMALADAALIANAPSDLTFLLAERDALREVISRITDEATDLIGERDAAVEREGRLREALTIIAEGRYPYAFGPGGIEPMEPMSVTRFARAALSTGVESSP